MAARESRTYHLHADSLDPLAGCHLHANSLEPINVESRRIEPYPREFTWIEPTLMPLRDTLPELPVIFSGISPSGSGSDGEALLLSTLLAPMLHVSRDWEAVAVEVAFDAMRPLGAKPCERLREAEDSAASTYVAMRTRLGRLPATFCLWTSHSAEETLLSRLDLGVVQEEHAECLHSPDQSKSSQRLTNLMARNRLEIFL